MQQLFNWKNIKMYSPFIENCKSCHQDQTKCPLCCAWFQKPAHWCLHVYVCDRGRKTEQQKETKKKKLAANFLLIFSLLGPRLKQLHEFGAKTTSSTSSWLPRSAHCLPRAREPIILHSDHFFLPSTFPSSSRQWKTVKTNVLLKIKKKQLPDDEDLVCFTSQGSSLTFTMHSPHFFTIYFWRKRQLHKVQQISCSGSQKMSHSSVITP